MKTARKKLHLRTITDAAEPVSRIASRESDLHPREYTRGITGVGADQDNSDVLTGVFASPDDTADNPHRAFVKPRQRTLGRIVWIVVMASVGLLSGFIGALFALDALSPSGTLVIPFTSPERSEQVIVNFDDYVARVAYEANPVVVTLLARGGESGTVIDYAQRVKQGLVMTNDGWIAFPSSGDVFAATSTISVLVNDGRVFPVEQVEIDEVRSIAYVKISARDLIPANFRERKTIIPGMTLLLVKPSTSEQRAEVRLGAVVNARFAPPLAEPLVRSSEDSFWPIETTFSPGKLSEYYGPVFDLGGNVVGMLLSGTNPQLLMSGDEVKRGLTVLLSPDSAIVPWLGVYYIDLADYAGQLSFTAARAFTSGALLAAVGAAAAVERGSPAALAGLKTGDIVLAVEHEPVDAQNSLAELIQSYTPGEEIVLTVQRGDEQLEVNVRLGEVKI